MDSGVRFSGLFGFQCVRVLPLVRFNLCSACSVEIVEKLWRNMRKSLWNFCGKDFLKLWIFKFCTFSGEFFHVLRNFVESFTTGFTHRFTSVKTGFCTFSTEFTITTTNILGREKKNGN